MHLNRFMKDAGFKILALSGLSSCQYSIILYLLNCSVSGMDEIITTYAEFSSLIGVEEDKLKEALLALIDRNMIRLHQAEGNSSTSLRVSFEFESHHWNISQRQNLTPRDAVVFPFVSQKANRNDNAKAKSQASSTPAWEKVLNEYIQERSLGLTELDAEEEAARLLTDTHPIEQIELILRHFGKRIKSLNLLAGSWQHFQELFESETQRVDLIDARKKHQQLDEKLRSIAREWLSKAPDYNLSEDETAVLKVIVFHQHPRRQLYWAYQLRERYENLKPFFLDNAELMLSITTQGTLVKRHGPEKT